MGLVSAVFLASITPAYVLLWYRDNCIWSDYIFVAISFVFCVAASYLIAFTLQTPYLMYYQNFLYYNILLHTNLDFSVKTEMAFWFRLRTYYSVFIMPINYALAQWTYLLFLSVGVLNLLFVVIRTFTLGEIVIVVFEDFNVLFIFPPIGFYS